MIALDTLAGAGLGALFGLLGGRIAPRWMETPIRSREYILSALAGAACGGLLGWRHGMNVYFLRYMVLLALLLPLALIDFREKILPNEINLAGAVLAVLLQLLAPTETWQSILIGLAAGGGSLLLLALVYPAGMGMGDVKLAAVLGLFFGWPFIIVSLFLAFLFAAVITLPLLLMKIVSRKDPIPFGPFIALGAIVTAIWGADLFNWYWGGF